MLDKTTVKYRLKWNKMKSFNSLFGVVCSNTMCPSLWHASYWACCSKNLPMHIAVFKTGQHMLLSYVPCKLDTLVDIAWCLAAWNRCKVAYLGYLHISIESPLPKGGQYFWSTTMPHSILPTLQAGSWTLVLHKPFLHILASFEICFWLLQLHKNNTLDLPLSTGWWQKWPCEWIGAECWVARTTTREQGLQLALKNCSQVPWTQMGSLSPRQSSLAAPPKELTHTVHNLENFF